MLWWPHNMDAPLIFGQKYQQLSSLSMNGCGGDPRAPLGLLETRTFAPAPTPSAAADRLNSAIYDLKTSSPPPSDSGIIRIEVSLLLDLTSNFSSSTIVYRGSMQKWGENFNFFVGICHVVGCERIVDCLILILILHLGSRFWDWWKYCMFNKDVKIKFWDKLQYIWYLVKYIIFFSLIDERKYLDFFFSRI